MAFSAISPLIVGIAPAVRVQYVYRRSELDPPTEDYAPAPSGYEAAGPWQIVGGQGDGWALHLLWGRVCTRIPVEDRIDRLAAHCGVSERDWQHGLDFAPQRVLRTLCRSAGLRLGREQRTVEGMRAALRAWAKLADSHEAASRTSAYAAPGWEAT